MTDVKLTERGEKIREFSTAQALGHLEVIMSKKDEILAFGPDELSRISTILNATKAAGIGCCTGG